MKTAYYFHSKYCWEKEIFIYPVPIVSTGNICKIAIKTKGVEKIGETKFVAKKIKVGKSEFKHIHFELWDKIRELYKTIYEKKNEPLNI